MSDSVDPVAAGDALRSFTLGECDGECDAVVCILILDMAAPPRFLCQTATGTQHA